MSTIFLGRPIHWLIVVVLCVLGWLAGVARLHVTNFNLFIVLLLVVSVVSLVAILSTSGSDARVTRDPLVDE